MIYTNLGRTRLAMKCEEYGIYKNVNGYYKREELDFNFVRGATEDPGTCWEFE